MPELSLPAALALVQEQAYQRTRPRREETDAELAARGCMYYEHMHAGTVILINGRTLDDDLDGYMVIEQLPVLVLSDGEPDTTSDPFARTLTTYRARDLLSGREGKLLYGPRGVVRTRPQLPYFPLATEAEGLI